MRILELKSKLKKHRLLIQPNIIAVQGNAGYSSISNWRTTFASLSDLSSINFLEKLGDKKQELSESLNKNYELGLSKEEIADLGKIIDKIAKLMEKGVELYPPLTSNDDSNEQYFPSPTDFYALHAQAEQLSIDDTNFKLSATSNDQTES